MYELIVFWYPSIHDEKICFLYLKENIIFFREEYGKKERRKFKDRMHFNQIILCQELVFIKLYALKTLYFKGTNKSI